MRHPDNTWFATTNTINNAVVQGDELDDKMIVSECMHDMSPEANDEVHGNMVFLNDSCCKAEMRTNARWWQVFSQPKSHEVAKMLGTPTLIQDGLLDALPWSTTLNWSRIALATPGNYNNLFTGHLAGVAAYRATWCFRVEVAATPFVGGFIRMVHVLPGLGPQPPLSATQLVAYPGVDMDISATTSVEFRIPHRALEPYFLANPPTVMASPENNGSLCIQLRTPINKIATTPMPAYHVWFWLEDIEIVGRKAAPGDLGFPAIASGGGRDMQVSGEEHQQGPVSGFLLSTARVVDWAGTLVPTMSGYTSVLSWMARASSRVASAFGFSRPISQHPVKARIVKSWGTYNNATGTDLGYNMATFHDTQVTPAPIMGDEEDCASVAYLVSRPHYLTTREITATPVGALLMKGSLMPMALMSQGSNKVTARIFNDSTLAGVTLPLSCLPSPAMLVASYFTYWRGGFKFKIRLAKTKMHAGKLLFVWDYTPVRHVLGADNCPVVSYTMSNTSNRITIDLKEGNDITIDVPWFYHMPFCPNATSIGSWALYVVDPLTGPATVSSSITLEMDGCMTQDTIFAGPRDSPFVNDDSGTFAYASGGGRRVDLAAATVGEDVMSLKQVAMIASRVADATVATTTGIFGTPQVTRNGAGLPSVPSGWSLLYTMRRMFAAERGSIILTLGATTTTGNTIEANYTTAGAIPNRGPGNVVREFEGSCPRLILPRYAGVGATYTPYSLTSTVPQGTAYCPWFPRTVVGATSGTLRHYLSAADDTSWHGYRGPGPMIILTNSGYGDSTLLA